MGILPATKPLCSLEIKSSKNLLKSIDDYLSHKKYWIVSLSYTRLEQTNLFSRDEGYMSGA